MLKYLIIPLPLVAHILIEFEYIVFSLIPLYVSLLLALGMVMGLSLSASLLQACLVAGALGLGVAVLEEPGFTLYIPSVATPLVLFAIFSLSLLKGRTPIITRVSHTVHAPEAPLPRRDDYTRLLTGIWAVIFLALAAESAALAYWSTIRIWSLFANILNYLFIVAFFILEYLVRIHLLKDLQSATLSEVVRTFREMGPIRREKGS